jgi:predicted tellurium resistance membrane protein TerC
VFGNQMIKYGLAASVIINAVFLMYVLGVVYFLLYVSALINILLIVYCVTLLRKENRLRDDVMSIFKSIEEFSDHLDNLYSLETFYGDETIQGLIDHSRGVINDKSLKGI